jgi:hypothetical protein
MEVGRGGNVNRVFPCVEAVEERKGLWRTSEKSAFDGSAEVITKVQGCAKRGIWHVFAIDNLRLG